MYNSIALYPILKAHVDSLGQDSDSQEENKLKTYYEREKSEMIRLDPQLSPSRAGCLAAAKLAEAGSREFSRLEAYYKPVVMGETPPDNSPAYHLYNWLLTEGDEYPSLRFDLVAWSGSRTLIEDRELFK